MSHAEMSLNAETRFWDRHAEGYAKRPVSDEASYQKKLDVTRTYFRPDMRVLEFGCGTGSTAIWHGPCVKSIDATDISPKMIEIARSKAEAAGIENVTFRAGTLDDVDAAEGSYDAVMGHSILHLLEDKEAAMARVHTLLKPSGLFISSTACLSDMSPLFRLVLKVGLPIGHLFGLLPLVTFFSKQQLLDSLTAAGFEIEHEWQPGKGKGVFVVARKPA